MPSALPRTFFYLTGGYTRGLSGRLATYYGDEHQRYYRLRGNDMKFGAHSINVTDFVSMALEAVPEGLLPSQ